MNVVQCYKILGLNAGATLEEVKASYRSLARQFHPDVNPDARAHDKFIELHQAYQFLLTVAKPAAEMPQPSPTPAPTPSPVSTSGRSAKTHVTPKDPFFRNNPRLTDVEELLKQRGYLQLQQLLKDKRFPRAVALVEALAQRIAHDREIQQWLAIAYQRWGRHAIAQGELEKARLYLKKALRTDPHNRSLWVEVERDFRRMEQIFR
ncbi:J domain-containing protein [Phormidium sp. CCY1219]|uniref:J domain-containing protein n=1 Tax=Phormidium sp. CCY1219 TaxID=2886104 RepID=UPI002D1F5F6E|nr:J domain-containing protein [Phormidium sp. CCY1219]MEB3828316.1 J domain-containing protein [Phormidium sp. CCY1219]